MADTLHQRYKRFINGLGDRYEPYVRQHLSQVYLVLGATTAFTAVGSMVQMFNLLDLGMLAAIGSILLLLALNLMKYDGKNFMDRFCMLLAFGFCNGQNLGPLLSYVVKVDATIILTALLGTLMVFLCLSLAAIFADRGRYLYLGGFIFTVINGMLVLSVLNLFIKSYFVQTANLFVGVFLMAGCILFDTQNIIEKCRLGDRDVIGHAMDLFVDIFILFRRLLIILTQKTERQNNNRKKY